MAGALNSALPAYLTTAARLPFSPGGCDCVLFACDWVRQETGRDPAAPWRGYGSAKVAGRIVARAGGMVALVSDGMARAGFVETEAPMPGDVGIIDSPLGPLMAIRTPLGWAAKTATGVACVTAQPLKAWAI